AGKARRGQMPDQCRGGFSCASSSLSAIRLSSGSEWAFIFRIRLLRCTFTVLSVIPMSPAICLLRRPCAGVCPRTVRKWVARFEAEGVAGLQDRSSRPHRLNRPTPGAVVAQVEALRRQRFTGKQIAVETGVSPATVSRILRRLGLNRIAALEPAEPVRRYERENPG